MNAVIQMLQTRVSGFIDEDDRLVRAFVGGESLAFEELYHRHSARVYTYLKREVGPSAEDLLQETFIRLAASLPNYRPCGKFGGYAFQVARNLVRNHRRRARPAPASLDAVQEPAERCEPESDLELEQALGNLPAEQREVLLLRTVGGLSFVEIAELTRRPLGTVLARMHRGLDRLRRLLGQEVAR
jgi:RNA polymerase sigma factor (sigma-70 family)